MGKKIISGEMAKSKMEEAINLLSNTVKITLGPKGKNVVIGPNYMTPYITNDGVTIAKEVESDDPFIEAILEIAKEASIKTNDEVGDGTTTSLVLLQSIFNGGLKLLKEGVNPIILRNEMNRALEVVINKLKEEKIKIKLKDIPLVASISSGDESIGKLIYDTYLKVGEKGLITIDESLNGETHFKISKGLSFDSSLISNYMLKNQMGDELKDVLVLISNFDIDRLELITPLLNEVIDSHKSLLIICDKMSDEVMQTLTLNRHQNILDVIAVSLLNYGDNKDRLLKDIAIMTNGKYYNKAYGDKLDDISISLLGSVSKVKVDKEKTTIIDGHNSKDIINNRLKEIKEDLEMANDFDREFHQRRMASFNKGIATIYVGGNSKTEMIEKKMRIVDALEATKNALNEGVIEGGGLTYLRVANLLKDNNNSLGMKLILEALEVPFKEIINNIGLDYKDILIHIKNNDFKVGFNALTERYGKMTEMGIIDPLKVALKALINATSVGGMLLTTECIIVSDEDKDKIKEEIDQVY